MEVDAGLLLEHLIQAMIMFNWNVEVLRDGSECLGPGLSLVCDRSIAICLNPIISRIQGHAPASNFVP